MLKHEYDELQSVTAHPRLLHVANLDDQSDRTLMYGYHCDGSGTVHVYLQDQKLNILVYNHDEVVVKHLQGFELCMDDMLPSKRAYPECCDYQFSELLIQAGKHISFTTFDTERKPSQFYGKKIEELNPTPQEEINLRKSHEEFCNEVKRLLVGDYLWAKMKKGFGLASDEHDEIDEAERKIQALCEPLRLAMMTTPLHRAPGLKRHQWNKDDSKNFHEMKAEIISIAAASDAFNEQDEETTNIKNRIEMIQEAIEKAIGQPL